MVPTSLTQNRHIPVMLMESLENLKIKKNGVYVDGTLGLGGHSEIILQQTQVKQGLPYYESFLKAFPSVVTLANAKEEDVLKLWQGLGYYSRARNLHDTAKIIHKELNNEFPNSYSGLIKLKGIGDYTASAIASFCYNAPCAVVDGNVYRVLSRIFGIGTPINSSKGIKLFKILAEDKLNKVDSAIHNQAIMEFGAL